MVASELCTLSTCILKSPQISTAQRWVLSLSSKWVLSDMSNMHELSKNRMVPKISNFLLGLNELKCAVFCYFHGFYSVVWQFGTSAFHIVVLWHKLGEVESEYTSHNFSFLAIYLPKIIKFGGNLTTFRQIQICLVSLRHGVVQYGHNTRGDQKV